MAVTAEEELLIDIGVNLKEFNTGLKKASKNSAQFMAYVDKMRTKYAKKAAQRDMAAEKKMYDFIINNARKQHKEMLKLKEKAKKDAMSLDKQKYNHDLKEFKKNEKKKQREEEKRLKFIADMQRRSIARERADIAAAQRAKEAAIKRTAVLQEQQARRDYKARYGATTQGGGSQVSEFGKRGLVDSARIVAKYGAISQVLYGIQNALGGIAGEAIKSNDRLYENIAILNKTREEALSLVHAVGEIGRTYGGDLNMIQSAMLTLGRAGVEETKVLAESTKVLRELALITGDDMRDGAEAMSSLVNVYEIGGDKIRYLGDQMAYVANETRLGVKDFSTISNYALVAAKNIGLTQEAYFALNGVLSKAGFNASTIGTNIRRLNKIMFDDSKQNIEMFRVLGYRQKEFSKGMQEDSIATLSEFVEQLQSIDDVRYNQAVSGMDVLTKQLIDGLRGGGKFFDDFIAKFAEMKKEGGDLENDAKTMTKGMTLSFEKLWNNIKTGSESFATLEVDISGIYDAGRLAADGIEFIIDAINDLEYSIPIIKQINETIDEILDGGDMANIHRTVGLDRSQLNAQVKLLTKKNREIRDGFFAESEGNKAILAQNIKLIAAKRRALKLLSVTGVETVSQIKPKVDKPTPLGPKEKVVPKEILSADKTKQTIEYERKLAVAREKLNGTYDKTLYLQKDLISLKEKRDKAEKTYNSNQSAENQEAVAKVKADIALKELAIRQSIENDRKKAASAGSADERASLQNIADKIALLQQEATLDIEARNRDIAKQGIILTEYENNKLLSIEAQNAYAIEVQTLQLMKEEAKLTKDKAVIEKKINSQKIKIAKADTKRWKAENKNAKAFQKTMEGVADSFADGLLSGDIKGAFKGLFDDILNVFLQPLKDSFVNLFGATTKSLFEGFYSSLTDSVASWAGTAIVEQQVVGQAAAVTGVATQATGDPYTAWTRMAAMAATMAGIGFVVGSIGGGSESHSMPSYSTVQGNAYNGGNGKTDGLQNFKGMALSLEEYNDVIKLAKENSMSFNKTLEAYNDLQSEAHEIWTTASDSLRKFGIQLEDYQDAVQGVKQTNGFSELNTFFDNFSSDAEKIEALRKESEHYFGLLGVEMPRSSAQARAEVEKWLTLYAQTEDTALRAQYLENADDAAHAANIYHEYTEAAKDAAQATEDMYSSLVDIASLKADWVKDLKGARMILAATIKETGISGVTADNFLKKFSQASRSGMTNDDYSKWSDLSSAIKSVEDALREEMEELQNKLSDQLSFYQDVFNRVNDSYLGSLSYLNTQEKADYASTVADTYLQAGDTASYLDTLQQKLEYERATSLSKEDYIPKFNDYLEALKNAEPEKTTDDVVESIEETNAKIAELTDMIERHTNKV